MPHIDQAKPPSVSGADFPSTQPEARAGAATQSGAAPARQQDAAGAVSDVRHDLVLINRVTRVLHHIWMEREVEQDEIRQHAADCRALMENADARFQAYGDPSDRDEAVIWMHRHEEALRALAPRAPAAAPVFRDAGAGYFIDAGVRDRAALADKQERGG